MSDGFRWLDAAGEVAGPRHRSIVTAARYLARAPFRPRVRPAPAQLMAEGARRRRPLSASERSMLVRVLAVDLDCRRPPAAAHGWLRRQARVTAERQRRRASLGLLVAPMRGARLDRIQRREIA